jgi:DNA-binding NarL/FixJ family response regulator
VSQPNQRSILIVDDSASDRAAYVRYLQAEKNFSYQIIETETLEQGLESWERNRPDLVLLDINLPDGSGLDFLQAIAPTDPAPKLPVIVMTGQKDTRVTLDALKFGACDYLLKDDINSFVFRRCVSHALTQLELSRKLERSQQRETLQSRISLQIQTFSRVEAIYQTIVTEVRQFLVTDRVIIYRFNADMTGFILAESVIPPWETSLHAQINDTCLQENQGIAYQQGKIFTASDIYQANLTDCHLEMLERFQVRANLVVPRTYALTDQFNYETT